MKYFSTFSGIGGFEKAIQQAYEIFNMGRTASSSITENGRHQPLPNDSNGDGRRTDTSIPECIGYSEIDKYAIQIYEKHFNHKNFGDITKINAEELPDFDLLVGGFPCQAFSIAGKRKGFEDTRGTLFFDLARILRAKQPKLFVFENVKGLLSHDNGNTFKTIISTLDELGYDLQWQVLNSKNHGVPQNRERVFIIGNLRGTPRPKVFPFGETNGTTNEGYNENPPKSEVAQTIRTRYGNGTGSHIAKLNNPTHSNNRIYGTDGLSPTINTAQGVMRQPKIIQKSQDWRKDGTLREFTEVSPTIRAEMGDNHPMVSKDMKIRRLTPTECERLQGFPEIERYDIMEVCLDHQNNSVNVEIKNPKLLKYAGGAEKSDSKETVLSVGKNLSSNNQQTNKLVQPDVLMDCVENGVEIHSQGKLLLNAKFAEKKNWSHPHIKIDDFVQMLVGLNIMSEKIIKRGEEELLPNEQSLIVQKNGKKLEKLFGKETMQPVGYVENDLTTLNELLKLITSNHLDTESLEQKLQILSLFVIRAINGYIPRKILNQNIFTIGIRTRVGYTYGVSDTQRYKTLGNAVTVNTVQDVMEKLLPLMGK